MPLCVSFNDPPLATALIRSSAINGISLLLLLAGGWVCAEINRGEFLGQKSGLAPFVWLAVIHPASLKSSILKTTFTAELTVLLLP